MIKSTNINFDIISETRILKDTNIVKNINIPNFSFEFTPTESTAGGTLLYIADHLAYQNRNDLNLYKTNNLESIFIEITNPNKSNIIVGYIYRHPKMDLFEFIHYYLNTLLEKLAKEQKTAFLRGDFNVDLLKYEQHKATNEFLDSLSSNMFLPHIVQPTRITSHSKTLIDNIFSNYISQDIVSGCLTATISDHLPQFLIFSNVPNRKTNIFERDWSKFNHEEFVLDYFSVDWPHILKLQNNDIDASFQNFFDSMNNILDKHALFKKIIKYKLKFRTKPWITPALQKSIFIKNKIFKNYIKKKDITQKNELHDKHKIYRNLISTLMKRSKQNYYSKYFERNLSVANKRFSVGRSKRAGGLGVLWAPQWVQGKALVGDGGQSPRQFMNFRLFEGLK